MKKFFMRIGVLAAVFIAGIVGFSHVMNIENTDRTGTVAQPMFPVVYIRDGDQVINEMFGYADEMQANYMRDTLTLLPSDYCLTLAIDTFGAEVEKVSYEVRSSDALRLVERTDVTYFTEKEGYLNVELPIKKLLEKEEEYILRIILDTDVKDGISYYTRIVDREDYDCSRELAFCLEFSDMTFDSENASELSTYLEPNSQGDNSSFGHVDIHSNYRMVTYYGLNAQRVSNPVLSLMEARSSSVSVRLTYLLSTQEEGKDPCYYNVVEYYRVRAGSDRLYLLDYDRTMNQIFLQSSAEYGKDSICLGILSEEAEYMTSEDGRIAAFVQEGVLWCYNNTNGQITRVFGAADDVTDVRKRRCDYDISIADVDETGSMDFLVYGYMNQGRHEGSVGILVCRYDASANTVEERVFLPYDKGYAQLREEMGQLAYVSRSQELYCILDGTVYCIRLADRTYEMIVDNLSEDCYIISEDGQMFAWLTEKDYDASDNLAVMNLETGFSYVISAQDTEYIRPVGFMGHDLIYGVADREMVSRDRTGAVIFPMKKLQIVDESGEDVREYRQEGVYITGTRMEAQMLVLERASYLEGTFRELTEDRIISNTKDKEGQAVLQTFVTDGKKTQYRLKFSSELKDTEPQLRTPKEVLFEVSRDLSLPEASGEDRNFYVYGKGRLEYVCQKAGDAIERADEIQGVVVNAGQQYIWEKGNRADKVEITGITAIAASEGESSIAVCVEQMLAGAGVYEDVNRLLQDGWSAMEILEEYLPGQVVDLSGCSLDAALYFVNRKVPVLAMKSENTAVLIAGYDEFGNTILFDPVTGTIGKCGPNDSKTMFEQAGNVFISYVPRQ